MNRNLDLPQSAARLASPGVDAAAFAPVSALGLLLGLVGNGIAALWTGYVRSLQRAGRLPPPL